MESHLCNHHGQSSGLSQTLDEIKFDSSIHSACVYNDLDRVVKLIGNKQGCATEKDTHGFTPLHYAARNGNYEICKYLIESGALVNAATRSCKSTPLHRAAYMSHERVIELLLKHGANPFDQDLDGKTPLHKCVENKAKNYEKVARLFVTNNKKMLEIKDANGKTPQDFYDFFIIMNKAPQGVKQN